MFEESGNIVENNIIRNNRDGMFVHWALNNLIKENKIYQNSDYGIEFLSGKESELRNNIVYNNGLAGIYLQGGADRNILTGNNITNNQVGLEIDQSNNNEIIRNNFIDNDIQAGFTRSHRNKWRRNYWSDWERLLPRPIKGSLNFRSITWCNFDWLPKKRPN
jgi:nitrous oxidase accessory protein